jgi:hypothetical protein
MPQGTDGRHPGYFTLNDGQDYRGDQKLPDKMRVIVVGCRECKWGEAVPQGSSVDDSHREAKSMLAAHQIHMAEEEHRAE